MAANLSVMYFTTGILFAVILPTMPLANRTADYDYASCSLDYSCGRIQGVGYPFWGDNRPEYCGLPDFKLDCQSSRYPTMCGLNISGIGPMGGHEVLSINTSNRTIMFALRDQGAACPHALHPWGHGHNFTNKSKPTSFKLGASSQSITLFYGCPNDITTRNHSISFPCQQSEVNAFAYFVDKIPEDGRCNGSVTLPVSKRALERLEKDRTSWMLEQVLTAPFEVVYNLSTFEACLKCQNSGGMCASPLDSSSDQLVCYKPGKSHVGLILGSASGVVVVTLILVAFWLRKRIMLELSTLLGRKATSDYQNIEAYLKMHGPLAPRRYTYASIRKMTNSFKEKLGEGGYAVVYKGTLTDGQLVAVKLLKQSKGTTAEEFLNEVASMGRTKHINVLTLLGFCFEGTQKALVFEFMANGSLDKFTHNGDNLDQPLLPWNTIFNIALGIARGLEYLHRGCNTRIVHFDIKPHNILLDEEFCPKISDFGLARLCPQKESTISMLEARGTIGYIAPEVFCRTFGGVSHKSDVYSYGMMVLDLVCGRRNSYTYGDGVYASNESCFTQWIYEKVELWDEVEVDGVMSEEERERQRKMLLVSLWCVQTYSSNRPSISKAVEMLEGSIQLIQMPPKPVL